MIDTLRLLMTMAFVFIATIAGLVLGPAPASAAGRPYVIANYPVEARAKDAVTAKINAIAEGERAAFRSLLKRLVPVTAYSHINRLKDVSPSTLLDGYTVRSERNSSTDYIAALDFVFAPENVRRVLREKGVPFVDKTAPETVLITAFRDAAGASNNARLREWIATWRGLDVRNALTPLSVKPMRSVVHADTIEMLRRGERGAERIISTEYGNDLVVAAIAELDTSTSRLNVVLSGRDGVGPFVWKQSYKILDNDIAYAMEYAAVVSLGVLEGRWKASQQTASTEIVSPSGPSVPILIHVNFANAADWYSIRDMLGRIPGVNNLRAQSVTSRRASISLLFPGGGEQLSRALTRQGYTLTNLGYDWLLKRNF